MPEEKRKIKYLGLVVGGCLVIVASLDKHSKTLFLVIGPDFY